MKKTIVVVLVVLTILLQTGDVHGWQGNEDIQLLNLVQDKDHGKIIIWCEGPLDEREKAVADLLELNFAMNVMEIEDIFEIQDDIHQFRGLSTPGVIAYEKVVRRYVEEVEDRLNEENKVEREDI